jgi:hypothetical protein
MSFVGLQQTGQAPSETPRMQSPTTSQRSASVPSAHHPGQQPSRALALHGAQAQQSASSAAERHAWHRPSNTSPLQVPDS